MKISFGNKSDASNTTCNEKKPVNIGAFSHLFFVLASVSARENTISNLGSRKYQRAHLQQHALVFTSLGLWLKRNAFPNAIAVNPLTNKIYVAAGVSPGNVPVIDGSTDSLTATVGAGAFPSAIAVKAATNKIYVANQNGNSVTVIDGATNATAVAATEDLAHRCHEPGDRGGGW